MAQLLLFWQPILHDRILTRNSFFCFFTFSKTFCRIFAVPLRSLDCGVRIFPPRVSGNFWKQQVSVGVEIRAVFHSNYPNSSSCFSLFGGLGRFCWVLSFRFKSRRSSPSILGAQFSRVAGVEQKKRPTTRKDRKAKLFLLSLFYFFRLVLRHRYCALGERRKTSNPRHDSSS